MGNAPSMRPAGRTPVLARPAALEAVILLTCAAAAGITAVAGAQMRCTALVEFGILSAIVAASAIILLARYAIVSRGMLTDYRAYECWSKRARTLCYGGLGLYALVNGVLDIAVPRWDSDAISYPGLVCAVIAVLVVTLVLETKYRVLLSVPSRSLFASLADDLFYLAVGVITLVALVAHVFAPTWWLDTALDGIFVVLAALRLQGFRSESLA